MNTIEIPESHRCEVLGVSYRFICNKCKMVWDVYVPIEESGPPDLWDVCRNCLSLLSPKSSDTSDDKKSVYKATNVMVKYPFLTNGYTGESRK